MAYHSLLSSLMIFLSIFYFLDRKRVKEAFQVLLLSGYITVDRIRGTFGGMHGTA